MTPLTEKLYMEHYGQGADLVLLHGWGLSSAIWQPLIEPLSVRYRLTLIDLPGLGHSRALATTTLESMADALLAVAPQRAIWLGWSLGGALALAAVAREPQRVSALVLAAATPCFVQRDGWSCAMETKTFDVFVSGLADNATKTLSRFAMLQTQGSANARKELRLIKQVIADSEASTEGLAATLELLREDLRPQLAASPQPLLLALGEQDPLVPVAVAESIADLRKDAVVKRYADAAHLPFIGEQERFIDDLDAFISGLDS